MGHSAHRTDLGPTSYSTRCSRRSPRCNRVRKHIVLDPAARIYEGNRPAAFGQRRVVTSRIIPTTVWSVVQFVCFSEMGSTCVKGRACRVLNGGRSDEEVPAGGTGGCNGVLCGAAPSASLTYLFSFTTPYGSCHWESRWRTVVHGAPR